jgi:peptidoglycan/LPS O-acetylase OafA/YrhL
MLAEKQDRARLGYLDGLRAVAVGLVVWFHAQLPGVPNGYLGVDIFFVISGFLITAQILDSVHAGSFSITDFYARRVLRICPPLLLVISATLIAVCLLLILPADMRRITLSAMASTAMVSNWYFLVHSNYFAPAAEREPLLHLWSLGVEEQYYLLAPAALVLGVLARRKSMNLYMLGLVCAAAILVFSLTAAFAFAASKPEHVFYSTPLRAWEIAAGAAAVLSIRRGLTLSRSISRIGVVVGLMAIGVASAVSAVEPRHRLVLQMLVVAGASLVALCGAFAQGGVASRVLGLRPMVGLGLISYSLYLWHWPVLAFWRLTHLDPTTPFENVLAGVIVPLLLAVLTYVTIERPIRAWRQSSGLAMVRSRTVAQGPWSITARRLDRACCCCLVHAIRRNRPVPCLHGGNRSHPGKMPPRRQRRGTFSRMPLRCRFERSRASLGRLACAQRLRRSRHDRRRDRTVRLFAMGRRVSPGAWKYDLCRRNDLGVMHAPERQGASLALLAEVPKYHRHHSRRQVGAATRPHDRVYRGRCIVIRIS